MLLICFATADESRVLFGCGLFLGFLFECLPYLEIYNDV